MLRNLINCHEQLGDYDNLRVVRALLHCDHRTPPGQAAGMVPYHGDEEDGIKSNGHGHGHGGGGEGNNNNNVQMANQMMLMRMLQALQMQQNEAEAELQ